MTREKTFKILIFAAFTVLVTGAAILGFGLTGSHWGNYQPMYNVPRPKTGQADYAGYNHLTDRQTVISLAGEWEFFYNRWIITDNEIDPAPDGLHQIPFRWTGKKLADGRTLNKTGYASYRLRVKNLNRDYVKNFRIHPENNAVVSYRIFVNGKLLVANGTLSKKRAQASTGVTSPFDTNMSWGSITNDQDAYTVVIEISDNRQGGFVCGIFMSAQGDRIWSSYIFTNCFPLILFGAILVTLVFGVFTYLPTGKGQHERKKLSKDRAYCKKRKRSSQSTNSPVRKNLYHKATYLKDDKTSGQRLAFLSLIAAVVLHFLFAIELELITVDIFRIAVSALPALRFVTQFLIVAAYTFYLYVGGMFRIKRAEIISLCAGSAAALLSYCPLTGTYFQIISQSLPALTLIWLCVKMLISKNDFKLYGAHMAMSTFLLIALNGELIADSAIVDCNLMSAFTVALSLFLIPLVVITVARTVRNEKRVRLAAETEAEVVTMKKQALKAQIKPHFIFNSLAAIKEIYRRDQTQGELLLTDFSDHLRANVDSDERDVVPFDDELGAILQYFELENIRLENKVTLIMNINTVDFSVPILSLQPFLENAVKYAGTHEKEDGFIEIKSYREAKTIIVQIIDNGVGFDASNNPGGGVGLKNASARLKFYLDAAVSIESKTGEGTTVTIRIPMDN